MDSSWQICEVRSESARSLAKINIFNVRSRCLISNVHKFVINLYDTPILKQNVKFYEARRLDPFGWYQFSYLKIFSTNQDGKLLLSDNPDRVRSQIISVVCQIQRPYFDCNLVVKRKVIILSDSTLLSKPL